MGRYIVITCGVIYAAILPFLPYFYLKIMYWLTFAVIFAVVIYKNIGDKSKSTREKSLRLAVLLLGWTLFAYLITKLYFLLNS